MPIVYLLQNNLLKAEKGQFACAKPQKSKKTQVHKYLQKTVLFIVILQIRMEQISMEQETKLVLASTFHTQS